MDTIIALISQYRYAVLFPLAAFEGPIIAFVVGAFVSYGSLDPVLAYVILLFGDLIPDTVYYYIGRYGSATKNIEKYLMHSRLKEHVGSMNHLWAFHGRKTMFFGKLAYGLSTPMLVSAGISGMSLGKFLSFTVPVTVVQYAALMILGYWFGLSFAPVQQYIEWFALGMAVVLVVLYFVIRKVQTYAGKKIQEEFKSNE